MLSVKLNYLDEHTAHRRLVAYMYISGIVNSLIQLPVVKKKEQHVWHVFVIRCQQREALQDYLTGHGIQTLVHYPVAPHKQKAYEHWNNICFPLTEKIHEEAISLPISPVMPISDVEQVIKIINDFFPPFSNSIKD